MAYLIIPEDGAEWQINLGEMKASLQQRWAEIVFNETFSQLEWHIPFDNHTLQGWLHNDRHIVSLFALENSVAVFAEWYRVFIPSQHQLTLCHDQSPEMIELHPGDTAAKILEELNKMT